MLLKASGSFPRLETPVSAYKGREGTASETPPTSLGPPSWREMVNLRFCVTTTRPVLKLPSTFMVTMDCAR